MLRDQHRRSARIAELDARKAQQEKSQNKGKGIYELAEEDLDTGEDSNDLKLGRKKVKSRSIQDHVVKTFELGSQKIAHSSIKDRCRNAAVLSPRTALPDRSKLELLLVILQRYMLRIMPSTNSYRDDESRKDSRKMFAEPVNEEEVKGYYDIIEEPMDFGKISGKLKEGSYQTLEEFEHDVFLVASNAMHFNYTCTAYYRQARTIRDLSKKLFDALRTDPENFTSEVITAQLRAGKRTKTVVEIPNKRASRGSKKEKNDNFVKDRRGTYQSWRPFRSENESIVSSFYEGPKPVIKIEQKAKEYKKSLMRFVQDLGPTAQMVAKKKLERCTAEALEFPINDVALEQKGATAPPSFLQSCIINENLNSKMLGRTLYGENASKHDNQHRNDACRQGYAQVNNKMIYSAESSSKPVQQTREGSISLEQNIAYQIIGSSYPLQDIKSNYATWKTHHNSDKFISSSYDKGKNVQMVDPSLLYLTQNRGDSHKKSVQAMRGGDTSLNYTRASEGIGGSNSSPSFLGCGNPYSSAAWNTNNNKAKCILSTANEDKKAKMEEKTCSDTKMQGNLFAINQGAKSSTSFHWPSPAVTGLNLNLPHSMFGMYSNYLDRGGHQVQAIATGGNTNYGSRLLEPTPSGSKPNLNVPMQVQVGAASNERYSQCLGWDAAPNEQFAESSFVGNQRHQTNSHGGDGSSGSSQNNTCQLSSPDDISWALRL